MSYNLLFLGDSYTIGEDVSAHESYPAQLTNTLIEKAGQPIHYQIVAKTGWTTDELLTAIKEKEQQLPDASFDLVFLLIGVNNQYRGYALEQYVKEFEQCLNVAMSKTRDKNCVVVLSIPDYGVTPFGKANQNKIRNELDIYNLIAKSICQQYNILFVDISDISRRAEADSSLLAGDQLHPSGKMYAQWVGEVLNHAEDTILRCLKKQMTSFTKRNN